MRFSGDFYRERNISLIKSYRPVRIDLTWKNFKRELFPEIDPSPDYDCIGNIENDLFGNANSNISQPISVHIWRDGRCKQVQRTESFNLIYRSAARQFTSTATFLISFLLSFAKFMDFHTDSGWPIRSSRVPSFVPLRFFSPVSSRSPLVFSPLSSFPFFFLGPVVDVLCHASYFHARTRRLHLLKAIHYDSKIISSIRLDGGEGDTL